MAPADVAEDIRKGPLTRAVGAGVAGVRGMMEADVASARGPKGKHDPRPRGGGGALLPSHKHAIDVVVDDLLVGFTEQRGC